MDDDQQFCLRWNNHQSTLISVFDTLLENETLVDCTLAAEGKFLKAHKVVLSACSPYFATLLSEQYDKHPIFILKDVKYQELRAMMDYMYRGEVNISQDQLAALLKAAESLQIKGLSDNRTGSGNSSSGLGVGGSQQQQQQKISAEQQQHKHISVPGKLMTGSASAGYTLEQTKRSRIGPSSIDSQDLSGSREGSSSPTSRRRKKVRRRSIENVLADNHDNSNSSQVIQAGTSLVPTTNATGTITAMLPMVGSGVAGTTTTIAGTIASTVSAVTSSLQQQHQQQQTSAASAAANIITANVTKKTESVKMGGNTDAMNAAVTSIENIQDENAADSIDEKEMLMKEKQNHKRPKHHHEGGVVATSTGKDEIVIEPKSEYDDEGNDETVEDLTLDDEEMGLEDLDHNAGPSHGGEGSSQGYAQWQVDRSQDEVYMAAQEAQQRDPQGNDGYWTILETVPYTLSGNNSNENPSTSVNHHVQADDNDLLAAVVVEIPSHSMGVAGSTIKYTIPKAETPILNPKPIITTTIPATTSGGARIQLVKKLTHRPTPSKVSTNTLPKKQDQQQDFINHQVDVIEQCLASAQVLQVNPTNSIELGDYEIQEQPTHVQEQQQQQIIDQRNAPEPQYKFKPQLKQELEALAEERKRKKDELATKAQNRQQELLYQADLAARRGRVIATNCLGEDIVDLEDEDLQADEDKFLTIRRAIREPAGMHVCPTCGKSYKIKGSLKRHRSYECGVTPNLSCRYCPHKSKYKSDLRKHIVQKHANIDPDII
ncbi:longitudinals lacking protein, isoforms H/M/V isoform X4 [Episyrphus balteatus]|uniref:longitudinals lacking protein, isoforms H/M/V isoform X4 n=1 Tax=Episyrphus balteatus TaxID=286459 RepID=UPI002486C4C4|nr:longitudinals lacking protein, isoforms H/M/V isoform X4 [Episyrphus balteatus]